MMGMILKKGQNQHFFPEKKNCNQTVSKSRDFDFDCEVMMNYVADYNLCCLRKVN